MNVKPKEQIKKLDKQTKKHHEITKYYQEKKK